MLFEKKESPFVSLMKAAVVPMLTVVGSATAAYFGARKGVSDTVEECATALEKVVPTFEGLLNKAEEAANAAPAAPAASDDEIVKYKEAIKKLMAEKTEAEARAAKAEAKPTEAPEAPKAEKASKAPKAEKAPKADAKAEAKTEDEDK